MVRRRAFLTSAAGGAALGLAGCLGGADSGGSLERLDVAGSPGGTVAPLPDDGVALLDFWATWCGPCVPQMAELRAVDERFPAVHLVSITNETNRAAIREFWTEHGGAWSVAVDPELRTNERFDVTRIPTLLVFDADGTEVWRHAGLSAADRIASALEDAGA